MFLLVRFLGVEVGKKGGKGGGEGGDRGSMYVI